MLLEIPNSLSKIHSISLCQNPIQEPFETAVHTRSFPSSSIQILFFPLLNFQFFYTVDYTKNCLGSKENWTLSGSVTCCVKLSQSAQLFYLKQGSLHLPHNITLLRNEVCIYKIACVQ